MVLDPDELDRIVYEVIRDRRSSHPTRLQIEDDVLAHIKRHISEEIIASIDRLVDKKEIEDDRDTTRGRPYTYTLPPSPFLGRRL